MVNEKFRGNMKKIRLLTLNQKVEVIRLKLIELIKQFPDACLPGLRFVWANNPKEVSSRYRTIEKW